MSGIIQGKAVGGRTQKALSPVLRVSLLLGIGIHLAGFLVFRVVSVPLPARKESSAFVQYVPVQTMEEVSELKEQAMLFDSAPLFIPTRWNAAQEVYEVGPEGASGSFPDFEPEIDVLGTLESGRFSLATDTTVEAPIDLLASPYWDFFEDFGVRHEAVVPFRDPQPVAKVAWSGGASMELRPELPGDGFPELLGPVTYYLRISAAGRAFGGPVLEQSSGNEAFDGAVLDWLKKTSVLAQLPAGYLEITVYP